MLKTITASAVLSLALATAAAAQNCPAYPYALTNGTTADASQVMGNFNSILNCIDNPSQMHFSNTTFFGNNSYNLAIYANTAAGGGMNIESGNPNFTTKYNLNLAPYGGNVGIGMTNPSASLSVAGQIMQVGAGLNLASSDANLIFGDWPSSTGWQQLFFNHNSQLFNLTAGLTIYGGLGVNAPTDTFFTVTNVEMPTTVDHAYLASFYTSYDSWQNIILARGGVANAQELAFGVNQGSGYSEMQATKGGIGVDELVLNRQGGPTSIGMMGGGYALNVGGTVYAYGAAGGLSDIREKDQVAAVPAGAIDIVQRLRPVTFVWKKPKDDGMQGQQMGFVAQEVEKVLPSAVLTAKDAQKTKALKYNELIALLTKAVQEQEAEIQVLKQQLASLKSVQ